jgi:hypothetical protein
MGKARERKLNARKRRQESLIARYGMPVQVPPPKSLIVKESVHVEENKKSTRIEKSDPGRSQKIHPNTVQVKTEAGKGKRK